MKYLKTFEAFFSTPPPPPQTTNIENIQKIQNFSNQTKKDTINLGDAFNLYNNSAKFEIEEVETHVVPVSGNVSDGVIIIRGFTKDYNLNIAVDGEVLSTDIDYSEEGSKVTGFKFDGNEYSIFVKEGSKVNLKILPLKKGQTREERCETWKNPVETNVIIAKKQSRKFEVRESGSKKTNYSAKVKESVPEDIKYPSNHSELIKDKSCLILDVDVDIEIESSREKITDGENMFKVGDKTFLYLASGSRSLTISTDTQDVQLDFAMALSNKNLPRLEKGEIRYITLNHN
jgi:hypothetical protein